MWRMKRLGIVMVAVAAATLASPAHEATAASAFTASVVDWHSGQCLAVWGNSRSAGAQVVQWPCNGARDKFWKFVPIIFTGYWTIYHLVNQNSGMCLTGSVPAGAPVVQQPCGDYTAPGQSWITMPIDSTAVYLWNYGSELVVGIAGSSTGAGATAVMWTHSDPPVDQAWRTDPVDG